MKFVYISMIKHRDINKDNQLIELIIKDKQLNKEYKQLSQKDQDKLLNYLYIKYLRYLY
mgnify:FL=1